ncbi:MAG: Ivy family c-type lysozyme inhibitor [Candidatus Moranbacteria bacterium]|nr:Ivy family c-type lysozyme inhibitor [Candidatus Moranbacteria bacterium]
MIAPNKTIKIFFIAVAVILLAIVVFLIIGRKQNQATTETSTTSPQAANQTVPALPQSTQPQTPSNQIAVPEGSSPIEEQSSYSYDILEGDPEILSSVQSVKSDFTLDDIGVSFPSATTKLKNGNDILILSGCRPHDCGGTNIVIAYNKADKKSYLLVEKIGPTAGYVIDGDPPQGIKNLLIYYFNQK